MLQENNIYLGDCLELMPQIKEHSVDLIICDLPYGVLSRSNKNAKWDNIIPFEPLWEQYERIIKKDGAIVLFGQGMFTAKLMMSNPKLWRYNLVWDKTQKTGFLNANRMPLRQHEDICVFYKSLPTYNPQMIKSEPHKRNHGKGKYNHQINNCYGDFVSLPTTISDEKFPTSIIKIPKNNMYDNNHPTAKPVNLMKYLIKTYSNENDLVLDNCMGGGSTIIAAIMTKRKYIGIELEEKFFKVAEQRIKKLNAEPTLF